MSKAIRNEYAESGVETFYLLNGDSYINPHEAQVNALIKKNVHLFDCSNILDLSCGGGEVTRSLKTLAYENIIGSDPFTFRLYEKLTGKKCCTFTFDDLVRGKHLGIWKEKQFSIIICSFALHLQPEKKLYPLIAALFFLTDSLVVISPHKRPMLENFENVSLIETDFELTERGKKVFLKRYGLKDNNNGLK